MLHHLADFIPSAPAPRDDLSTTGDSSCCFSRRMLVSEADFRVLLRDVDRDSASGTSRNETWRKDRGLKKNKQIF